eukprot:1577868-Amphidinium_carterae.3
MFGVRVAFLQGQAHSGLRGCGLTVAVPTVLPCREEKCDFVRGEKSKFVGSTPAIPRLGIPGPCHITLVHAQTEKMKRLLCNRPAMLEFPW